MNEKYVLTEEKKECLGRTLYRIKAIISFKDVAKGELGGWIEKEDNLSQDGNAWVFGDARVYGDACVYGDARVFGDARVSGKIKLKSVLCSRFSFEFDWQVDLWHKKEKEFEDEVKVIIK